MNSLSTFIKNHWHVYVALVALCSLIGSGVGYYARAEAQKLITKELSKPIDKLNDDVKRNRNKLNDLQIDVTKNQERLKAIDEKTDLILRFLQEK